MISNREWAGAVDHDRLGDVLDEPRMRAMAEELTQVAGIVGVVLGGSRARGEHAPDSDVDLGLYYRAPLDLPGLQALARRVADPTATLPGVDQH